MTADEIVEGGIYHWPLADAALCAETDCSRVFSLRGRAGSDGVVRCPACGSGQWVLLADALGPKRAEERAEIKAKLETAQRAIADALEELVSW